VKFKGKERKGNNMICPYCQEEMRELSPYEVFVLFDIPEELLEDQEITFLAWECPICENVETDYEI